MTYCYYGLLLLLQLPLPLLAQALPPLERLVSVDLHQEPIAQALDQISQAGTFVFAYNPAQIRPRTVTVRLAHVPVREILDRIFKGAVVYQSRGNYLILIRPQATATGAAASSQRRNDLAVDRPRGNRDAQAWSVAQDTRAPVPPLASLSPVLRVAAATGRPLIFLRPSTAMLPAPPTGPADSTWFSTPFLGKLRNRLAQRLSGPNNAESPRDTFKVKPAKIKDAKIKEGKVKPAKIKPAKMKTISRK